MEEFFDILGYEGKYQINLTQQVRSVERIVVGKFNSNRKIGGTQMTPYTDNHGYTRIVLRKNGRHDNVLLHRLMAIAFIPNPENKRTVNHKNGIKSDNRIENLEWATDSENIKHAFENGLNKPLKGEKNPMYNRRGASSPHYGLSRGKNYGAKLVIDMQSGIFYDCAQDAAEAKMIKSLNSLRQKLSGAIKNNTSLVYA